MDEKTDPVTIFKQRIEELAGFKNIDPEKVQDEKLRARARMAKNNLELNEKLLNIFMPGHGRLQ